MKVDKIEVALDLYRNCSIDALLTAASRKREQLFKMNTDRCAIVNARNGGCSEDCAFCAQSAAHRTPSAAPAEARPEEIFNSAQRAWELGATRFSLVTSGRTLTESLLNRLLPLYRELSASTSLNLCASHGFLTVEQARKLADAGVSRYHHNLESDTSFYPQICTTHHYSERIETLKAARKGGLSICSGGIWGMGETVRQRLMMAFALKEVDADSVPINILNPITGTPLEAAAPLPDDEFLRCMALYRLILPRQSIRLAGGRDLLSPDCQQKAVSQAADAFMTGDYLTTGGSDKVPAAVSRNTHSH